MLTSVTRTLFVEGLTQNMLDRWEAGELIQDVMPDISPDIREFLMTGISPKEWRAILGEFSPLQAE
jgi:hypothetical protein